MKPSRIPLLLTGTLFISCLANAQLIDTLPAVVDPVIEANQVKFKSVLRPLRGVAGAPAPFYTYFWEFGDGTYSFEKEPAHIYKDTGDYPVRLFATNNYDDGKKPPTRLKKIKVEKKTMLADNARPSFFKGSGALEMISNQQPRPGEDMVLLLGYRNKPGSTVNNMSGSIMLLYNEKQFGQNSFDMADARRYHNEQAIGLDSLMAYAPVEEWIMPGRPDNAKGLFVASGLNNLPMADKPQLKQLLKQQMETYRKHDIWRVNAVKQGEEQFMFLSLNTLPDMIKDTNAVVTISALFIPDDPALEVEQYSLEMQIVASHDPNKIMLKNHRLNYRFTTKNRENIYKIRFQNTGKGPAKRVAVTVTIPNMLNAATIEFVDSKPACKWCDSAYANQSCIDTVLTKDSIQFIFKNIYLPGTQQEGVSDPDSTMGYVRYKLKFNKKMKKQPFSSQASIVFDKNEPVYTNRSVGRFKRGLSPGIMIGYSTVPGNVPDDILPKNYVLGFTLSEYAAQKGYFQWELFLQKSRTYETYVGRRQGGDTIINGTGYKVAYRDVYRKQEVLSLEAVPVHFRYNFNAFLVAGAGALAAVDIEQSATPVVNTYITLPNGTSTEMLKGEMKKKMESFVNWRGAVFADAQVGRVRSGPAVGVRFYQYMNPSFQRLLLYASWKL
jgi:PKD repeat protein